MCRRADRLLNAGEIDVGVLRHPFDKRGLNVSESLGQPFGVLVDASHPLAVFKTVRLTDLNPYPLVIFERHLAPGVYDELLQLCNAGGYVPPRILHGARMTAILLRVEDAVTFTTEGVAKVYGQAGSKECVWKPLEGAPIHSWTSVVCRSNDSNGVTDMAMDALSAALQQHDKWEPMSRSIANSPSLR